MFKRTVVKTVDVAGDLPKKMYKLAFNGKYLNRSFLQTFDYGTSRNKIIDQISSRAGLGVD